MKTRIYAFSGTGNSLWAAQQLAQLLGDCELSSIPHAMQSKVSEGHASSRHSAGIAAVERSVPESERMQSKVSEGHAPSRQSEGSAAGASSVPESEQLGGTGQAPNQQEMQKEDFRPQEERIGIVAPVYMYRLPHLVVRFVERLVTNAPIFVVATAGGDPGDFFVHTERLFKRNKLELAQGLCCAMVSNYTPFGGAPDAAGVEAIINRARARLELIASHIKAGEHHIERAFSRRRAWIHPGIFYKLGYHFVPVSDKRFKLNETCNGCGICAEVCPVDNIRIVRGTAQAPNRQTVDKRPTWLNHCEQCMACFQWCSKEAIDIADKTQGKRRYRHPEMKLKTLIDFNRN